MCVFRKRLPAILSSTETDQMTRIPNHRFFFFFCDVSPLFPTSDPCHARQMIITMITAVMSIIKRLDASTSLLIIRVRTTSVEKSPCCFLLHGRFVLNANNACVLYDDNTLYTDGGMTNAI